MNLSKDPAMPLLDIYTKDAYSYSKGVSSALFIAVLFTIASAGNNLGAT